MNEKREGLAGQVGLVTGGSRGIGAAIARRLAADGLAVVLTYARSEDAATRVVQSIRDAGGMADKVQADLSEAGAAGHLFEAFDACFGGRFEGRIDVLVNNAGIASEAGLTEATDEAFDEMYRVNVKAVFQISREAARRMKARRRGRIINTGSNLGERLSRPNLGLYASTKFAIAGFTKAWSHDLGPHGVTVNAVQPGPIDTDLNPADGRGGNTSDFQVALTSVGRYGHPDEVAAAVAYLAGPQAGFTNGECLTVDGGQNA